MEESAETRIINKKKLLKYVVKHIKQRVPIVDWFPKYNWKENIVADLISGITLMVLNVPQGLAFSLLANVDLMFGLYTSCLASLIYTFLGTATISSFGPVAVGSMLTGEAVSSVMDKGYNNNDIVVVITLLIGVWYMVGFIFQLGVISMIFRKPFVTGFITACALHILGKSLKMIFGLKTPTVYGMFSFFFNLYGLYENVHLVNYPTLIISIVILSLLILNIVVIRPCLGKCTKIVLPMEAFVMVVGTLLSYLLNFEEMGVPVVGNVPTGFPTPTFPQLNIIPSVLVQSLVVAIINYSTTVSMTLLFNADLKSDQELFAMGIVNLICCNFQCITIGNSMMRTVIVVNLGVKSLIATIISSLLLVFVVLFGGLLFHPLPKCVLGCIIITSAGQLLIHRLMEINTIWRSSLENGLIWALTVSAGLIIGLEIGLMAGALLSVRQILVEMQAREKSEMVSAVSPETTSLIEKQVGLIPSIKKESLRRSVV